MTRDELDALMSERLVSVEPPAGTTRFADWLAQDAGRVGDAFVSDRRRHWESG